MGMRAAENPRSTLCRGSAPGGSKDLSSPGGQERARLVPVDAHDVLQPLLHGLAQIVARAAELGYALGEWVFGLVAAGMAIRLFTRDAPDEQSNPIAAYFVAVLTGLALVLWLVPGQGNGLR